METKVCVVCRESKPLSEFNRHKLARDGRQSYCKLCFRKYQRKWKRSNPNRYGDYNREYGKKYGKHYRLSAEGRYRERTKRGNRRGIKFSITKDEFVLWFNSQEKKCHYCGQPLVDYKNGTMQGLTMDRPNNREPYKIGNIVLACRRCNTMKGSWLTEDQMLDAAKRYFK